MFGPDASGRDSDLVRRSCDQQRISKSSELPEALGALVAAGAQAATLGIMVSAEPAVFERP